jgi:hypothetical protein
MSNQPDVLELDGRRRGVCYDLGRSFGGPLTRPHLDPQVVARELEIIRHDLGCNAVRICGADLDRINTTAEAALHAGLEAWLCPELFEHDQEQTLAYIAAAARMAEQLRRRSPGRVVLSIATELTFFMPGILPGAHFSERIAAPTFWEHVGSGVHNAPLNAFLAKAAGAVRQRFRGPITYASAPLEAVDWTLFDFVCVDAYRDARTRTTFEQTLDPYFSWSLPVVISETGCCTYRGAEDAGGMGWAIIDYTRSSLRLDGDYVRDEALQAREITETLEILDRRGVIGTFVMTFVSPELPHRPDPRSDLDMASYSLVKSYEGRRGASYPDMAWEIKQSFTAVAAHYAARTPTRHPPWKAPVHQPRS